MSWQLDRKRSGGLVLDELEVDVWDLGEELDAFLASTRAFRDADLA